MSIVSQVVDVPKQIIRPLLSPKTLLIGVGVTAGSLFILSNILPGIGALVGLRVNPLLPRFLPQLSMFPFVPLAGMPAAAIPQAQTQLQSSTPSGPTQEELGRAIVASSVNSAQGYVNAMLQVT